MNQRAWLRVLGFISVAIGFAMLPCAVLGLIDGDRDFVPFLVSACIPIVVGVATLVLTRGGGIDLKIRDGFAIVTFGWLTAAVFGALPFLLTGVCHHPADAFFESMSGFTTTGASIFTNIEGLPRSILLWRSLTQWMGGMGIVVLSVAVLPMLGVGGMQLFKAEVPGPTADRLTPRIQSTAKILWGVYFGITALEIFLLMLGGMGLFDAVCHSFSTVSTGGFSTRNASVGAYQNGYFDCVIIVFMFIAGVNFSLHFALLQGRWRRYWANEEFRVFVVVTVVAILLLWRWAATSTDVSTALALRQAVFQAVSILTTTGFGTADFLLWGAAAQLVLFMFMFTGACAGSTSGGMKFMRVILLARHGFRVIGKQLHPSGVFNVRYSGKIVDDGIMMTVLGFFLFFLSIFIVVALAVAATGVDTLTAFGASAASLGNIGPGLGTVGPASNFAEIPNTALVILSFAMLLGRLELITVLVVASPMFWRRA